MSNVELSPPVVDKGGRAEVSASPVTDLIPGRIAALGPDTQVRRLLPTLGRRMVGAWCFLDHYGPQDIAATPGMQVPPHPHTGLQTVSWLIDGEIHHRDSLGNSVLLRAGQLGLMTSGGGIAHSEQSPPGHPASLHGTQLWVALPDSARWGVPAWEFHDRLPQARGDGLDLRVLLGEFGGARSPGRTYTPIVGVDVRLAADTSRPVPLEADFEYAAIAVAGSPEVDGILLPIGSLLYLGAGRRSLKLAADSASRMLLLGGEPFAERIVMWWNFVGRSHEEIADLRADWAGGKRFDAVPGWDGVRLDAPPMPNAQLKAR